MINTAIITGASGFIGSTLANYLLKNKYISVNKKKQFTINMKDQALSDTVKIQQQNISSLSDLVCKIFEKANIN